MLEIKLFGLSYCDIRFSKNPELSGLEKFKFPWQEDKNKIDDHKPVVNGHIEALVLLRSGRKTEQLGSMNDLSGMIGYRAAVFMGLWERRPGPRNLNFILESI
jgi:hypothetical protein